MDNGLQKYSVNKHGATFSSYIKDLQINNPNLTFYKNISPEKISSIYLGCRYPASKEIDLIQKMYSAECKIKHAKIFKMTICPMEFKLIPKQIFPPLK